MIEIVQMTQQSKTNIKKKKKQDRRRTVQQKVVGGSTAKPEFEGGKRLRFSEEKGCGKKWIQN